MPWIFHTRTMSGMCLSETSVLFLTRLSSNKFPNSYNETTSSSSSGTELPLMVESYGLLNDIFPFPLILDADYPIFNLHLANVLFDVILPSVLGSSLWSIKATRCTNFSHLFWNKNSTCLLASCQQTCMTYTIAVCTVKTSWWWTEELSETYSKNKFEKFVHLAGFIIIIYHDARSPERQSPQILSISVDVRVIIYGSGGWVEGGGMCLMWRAQYRVHTVGSCTVSFCAGKLVTRLSCCRKLHLNVSLGRRKLKYGTFKSVHC